jgi:hypothetical protein
MNTNVQALMKQADQHATDTVPYFRGELGGEWERARSRVRNEKFAQLLILNCRLGNTEIV